MKTAIKLEINRQYICDRIYELGIKFSWLASKIGVSEKTIERWVTGNVRCIRTYNAIKLAQYLECGLDKIIKSNDSILLDPINTNIPAIKQLLEEDIYKLQDILDTHSLRELLIAMFYENMDLKYIRHTLFWLFNLYLAELNIDMCGQIIQEALVFAKAAKQPYGLVVAYCQYAEYYWNVGKLRKTEHFLNKAYSIYKRNPDIQLSNYVLILLNHSIYYMTVQKYENALDVLKEALQIIEKCPGPEKNTFFIDASMISIQVLIVHSKPQEAIAKINSCSNLMLDTGYTSCFPQLNIFKAHVQLLSGHALDFDLDPHISEYIDSVENCYNCYPNIGAVYRLLGNPQKSLYFLEHGLQKFKKVIAYSYPILLEMAECYKMLGDIVKAEAYINEAMQIQAKLCL